MLDKNIAKSTKANDQGLPFQMKAIVATICSKAAHRKFGNPNRDQQSVLHPSSYNNTSIIIITQF